MTELYIDGCRQPRTEVRASCGADGELKIGDWLEENAAGRALRVAHFQQRYGVSMMKDVFRPLFDPQLVRMTSSGFVLRGYQIDAGSGEPREQIQAWWVRPIVLSGTASRRGSSTEPREHENAIRTLEVHK